MTYPERLNYLNLHSLKGRRLRGDLIETYKIFNGLTDIKWNAFFEERNNNIKTRNQYGKIFHSQYRTNIRGNFFSNRVNNSWNSLTPDLKQAFNINEFKNNLDVMLTFKELFKSFD